MNTVLSSYGQLCGCPEILKKSCKFFCRGLDIRVAEVMQTHLFNASRFYPPQHFTCHIAFGTVENPVIRHNPIQHTRLLF